MSEVTISYSLHGCYHRVFGKSHNFSDYVKRKGITLDRCRECGATICLCGACIEKCPASAPRIEAVKDAFLAVLPEIQKDEAEWGAKEGERIGALFKKLADEQKK